jgi:hypothetical protein
MCGEAGEERFRSRVAEAEIGNGVRGGQRGEAETSEQEWMARKNVDWSEDFGGESRPVASEWFHEAAPGVGVAAERVCGVSEVAIEKDGGAVVERVRECGGGVNPLEAVIGERERGEKWRSGSERVNCGAEVVTEAGECEFECASGAAGLRFGFEYVDA